MVEDKNQTEYEVRDRRPMKPREWRSMRSLASALTKLGLTANAISVLSVVFALIGAAATVATAHVPHAVGIFHGQGGGSLQRGLWLIAAVGIELRALCNLLDGMVAVQTKTASPVGELYNEVPDRLSDVAMLVALGYAATSTPWLGWTAACGALLVAYVRSQAAASGAGQDYCGPMAKPVRMQLVALVCLFMAAAPTLWTCGFWGPSYVNGKFITHTWGMLQVVLLVITVGCAVTVIRRLSRASPRLRERHA